MQSSPRANSLSWGLDKPVSWFAYLPTASPPAVLPGSESPPPSQSSSSGRKWEGVEEVLQRGAPILAGNCGGREPRRRGRSGLPTRHGAARAAGKPSRLYLWRHTRSWAGRQGATVWDGRPSSQRSPQVLADSVPTLGWVPLSVGGGLPWGLHISDKRAGAPGPQPATCRPQGAPVPGSLVQGVLEAFWAKRGSRQGPHGAMCTHPSGR